MPIPEDTFNQLHKAREAVRDLALSVPDRERQPRLSDKAAVIAHLTGELSAECADPSDETWDRAVTELASVLQDVAEICAKRPGQ